MYYKTARKGDADGYTQVRAGELHTPVQREERLWPTLPDPLFRLGLRLAPFRLVAIRLVLRLPFL